MGINDTDMKKAAPCYLEQSNPCWGWPLSSHMSERRMGKHLPPRLNTAWESTSLRTTGAVLGHYLPTEAYLVLENEPRSLTLKTGRP